MSNKVDKKRYTRREKKLYWAGYGSGVSGDTVESYMTITTKIFGNKPGISKEEEFSYFNGVRAGKQAAGKLIKNNKKRFSKKNKFDYYSKRVNDMSLDQGQRSYAKKWLARNSK